MKYETVDSYDRLQLKTSRNTNNGIVVACGWAFYHGHVDEWISTQWRYAQTHHQSYQTVVFPSEMQKLMEICYFSNKLDEQSMWFSVWKSVTLPVSDETVRFSVNVVIVVIIKCVDTECFNSIHSQFYHHILYVTGVWCHFGKFVYGSIKCGQRESESREVRIYHSSKTMNC